MLLIRYCSFTNENFCLTSKLQKTGEVTGKEVLVSIIGEELKVILREELGSHEDQFYAVKPQLTANFFVPYLPNLKERLVLTTCTHQFVLVLILFGLDMKKNQTPRPVRWSPS